MVLNFIISLLLGPLIAGLIIAIVWTKRDKNRYPGLISCFIWGMLSITIFLLFQYIARQFGLDIFGNIRRIIFYSFVVMGLG